MCDCPPFSTSLQPPNRRSPRCLDAKIHRDPARFCPRNAVCGGKFGFFHLRAMIRCSFYPRSSRNGLFRSAYSNSAGGSRGKDTEKQKSLEGFVEVRSGDEGAKSEAKRDDFEASMPSSFDFLELKRELEKEEMESGGGGAGTEEGDDLVPPEGIGSAVLDEGGGLVKGSRAQGGRQMMRRSNLLAKQVISIQSAASLGFVSQLWVDTRSWIVVLVEVRPNLLSGEMEKFLLEDVSQVGDVLLVQDESVMENDFRMMGLDTLVGYDVVTSGRRNVGKVRGYTFNINTGAVELLELDSFGFSLIPASLVSTYGLLIEDVFEVVSNTIVVHESAISRVQKLSKGIWDTQNVKGSRDDIGEYFEYERRKNFRRRNLRRRMRDIEDDWDLPLDY